MSKESHISIFVKEMRVNVRIGCCDFEKEAPQPLLVSVELFTAPDYLAKGEAGEIIDYAFIHEAVMDWEIRPHVELIEPYLRELLDMAFGFKEVTACQVSICKPEIFNEAQQAGLGAYMTRSDYATL